MKMCSFEFNGKPPMCKLMFGRKPPVVPCSLLLQMIAIFVAAGVAGRACADELQYKLTSRLDVLEEFNSRAAESSIVPAEHLHLKWVGQDSPFEGFNLKSKFAIAGDFDIDLRFDVNQIGEPSAGWGAGVLVRLNFADWSASGISLQRQCRKGGESVVSLDLTNKGQAEHSVVAVPVDTDNDVTALSLSREGNELTVSQTLEDGKRVELWTKKVSTADVFPVEFHLHSGGAVADLDVEFESVAIRSDRILSSQEMKAKKNKGIVVISAVAVVLLLGGMCKLLLMSRKRT